MRYFTTFVAALLLLGAMFMVRPQAVLAQSAEIVLLTIDGPIYPAVADYIERGLEEADDRRAQAVVIQLNTPGGALNTTLEIVQLFRTSRIPVIVYVGPAGSQAASAGSIITMAGHVSGMAPQTTIGAASPVDFGGQDIGDTLYRKVVEDIKATVRSLNEDRPAEAIALAEAMVEDARAVSGTEALEIGLIDAVAADLDDLLAQLDGREVAVDGTMQTLALERTRSVTLEMNTLEEAQALLFIPEILSLLLILGPLAIILEVRTPGGWVLGFIGVVSLGLALLGMGQLPLNWFGLGLIVVAFILFILEALQPGVGALAVAGTITLVAGVYILFNSAELPEFARLSLVSAIMVSVAPAALFLWLAAAAIRIQRAKPLSGKQGMLGRGARARDDFQPSAEGFVGTVLLDGEIWRATATTAVARGDLVLVEEIEGLTAQVRPKDA